MFKQIKHSRFSPITALLAIAVIVLAACGSQPAATQPAVQETVPTVATAPAQATSTEASVSVNTPTIEAAAATSSPTDAATGTVSFSKDIAPILQNSCISCHGGEKTSKGLDMKTFDSLMTGSQNGAVVVTGDAAKSKLVQLVQAGKMPKRGAKLTADQIQLLVDWVNAGATNN